MKKRVKKAVGIGVKGVVEGAAGKKGRKAGTASHFPWGAVHWAMQDVEIARLLGCTREAVRQRRRNLGVGKSPRWHCRSGCAKERVKALDTSCMTLKQIALAAGCSTSYALQCVAGSGRGYKPDIRRGNPKHDWTKADWGMTDAQVAEAVGVNNPGVVSQYRFRHNIWKKGVKANVMQHTSVHAV